MSTSESNYSIKYFLLLMQSVLNYTPAPKAEGKVNWQFLYEFSIKHSLSVMLYYAIEKLNEEDKPQGEFMPYLKQMHQEQIVADLNLTFECERMTALLSKRGIRCLPVKGIVTKADYPVAYLRTMTDVDVLCDAENRLEVEKIFLQNGYEKESVTNKDTAYRKEEILHFEMHTSLLSSESPAFDYFSKVWDRVSYKENSSIAQMSLEDIYIFMLEHLANHVLYGGAGIRMYMDVYVFLQKHQSELDKEYINKILKDISLLSFEKQTHRICENWFSGKEEPDVTSADYWFIINSTTFGRAKMSFLSDSLRNSKDSTAAKNGVRRIFKKLFPTVSWMKLRYRSVEKAPLLYPVFVPVHWFERLFIRRDVNTSNLSNYFVSAESDEAKALREIYVSLGLNERI